MLIVTPLEMSRTRDDFSCEEPKKRLEENELKCSKLELINPGHGLVKKWFLKKEK